jgi:hypothetical protein
MPTLARLAYTRAHSDVSVATANAIGDVLHPEPATSTSGKTSTATIASIEEAAEGPDHVASVEKKTAGPQKERAESTMTGRVVGWLCVFGGQRG